MTYEIENAAELDEKALRRKTGKIATKSFSRVFWGLVLYGLISGLVLIAAEIVLTVLLGEEAAINALSNSYIFWGIQALAMYAIAFPLFLRYIKPIPTLPPLRDEKLGFVQFMRLFLVSFFLLNIGNEISVAITSLIEGRSVYSAVSSPLDILEDTPIIITLLIVVIIGPIFEELIFRRAFINCLGKYGERTAIIVSSIAFGLFHGNLNQFIYATLVGLVLGNTYVKTGRIRYSILLHIMINFFGTVPTMLTQAASEYVSTASDTASTEYLVASIALTLIPIIILTGISLGLIVLIRSKKTGIFKCDYACEIELSTMRKLRCVLLNLGVIVFLYIYITAIVMYLIPTEQIFNIEEINFGAETAFNLIFK